MASIAGADVRRAAVASCLRGTSQAVSHTRPRSPKAVAPSPSLGSQLRLAASPCSEADVLMGEGSSRPCPSSLPRVASASLRVARKALAVGFPVLDPVGSWSSATLVT